MSSTRPWTRSKTASGHGRPLTRGKQRGFYSEIVGLDASERIGDARQGPKTHQNVVWRSYRDKHLPNVSKFKTPDDFLDQLNAQVYGPTTQLIASNEFSSVAWDPKVQVPFKVDSGMTPRKLEIERRKRQFNKQARDLDNLLKQNYVCTQDLMPITDRTSKALLNYSTTSSASSGKQPTPTFPSFLPLEIFDNTELDCRTPQEWVQLGYESKGVCKPVPGKALLPVLESPPPSPLHTPTRITPTPPTGEPPSDASRPSRRFKSSASGTRSNPLPPLQQRSTAQNDVLKSRYEWVDIGMLNYDPSKKLYLVKRVNIPNHILQAKPLKIDSDSFNKNEKSNKEPTGEKSDEKSGTSSGSDSDGGDGTRGRGDGVEGEAGGASDGEQTASQPKVSKQQVAGKKDASKDSDKDTQAPTSLKAQRQSSTEVESEDGIHYWLPRVRIMFAAEDPNVFAERVAYAHKTRQQTEALLRYHLYVDCMPPEGIQEMDGDSVHRVVSVARSSEKLQQPSLDGFSSALTKEIQLEFTRSMNKILFDKTVTSQPGTFPFVTLPEPHSDVVPETGKYGDVPPFPFAKIREKFQFLSLLTSPEAISVMELLRMECGRVGEMSLFHTGASKHLKLEEFDSAQQQASVQVQTYLSEHWVPTLRTSIRTCMESVNKGWFNLSETSFEVYQGSKLKKLMELIKFAMQDSLRSLVLDSLASFVQMIHDACLSTLELPTDFQWKDPLAESIFKPLHGPIFFMDLVLDKEGCHYSTDLPSVQPTIVAVFDRGIQATHSVPQIEKFIVDKLFWPETQLLEAVGHHEPQVDHLRERISKAVSQAIIPVHAYSQQYVTYLDLMNLDIKTYVEGFATAEEMTTAQIREEIDSHLAGKARVESSLPQSVVIGPFFINTDTVRLALAKKHKDLARALLEFLVDKLRKDTEKIGDEFKEISYKLRERSNTIEDLTEQRDYLKTVPEVVGEYQAEIDEAMNNYDMIEEYFYPLSDDDFNNRWDTLAWSRRILEQVEITETQLENDEQKFHKKLIDDQTQLEDKLDTLQMIVAGFSGRTDLSKAAETSNEVRRVVKDLKECQAQAVLYNQRERLFSMPVTQYDKVGKLTRDFEPFKNLWLTAADWLKWYETWMNDSLINIDPEVLATNVNSAFKVMHKSVKHFKDIPGCLGIANQIKTQIEEFRPFLPLIQGLRNPGMRNRHWQKLSDELGITVQPKPTLTFSKCLEMGLQEHIEIIAKVADVASKEFSIEQALDKMVAEWESVLMEILAYKETGTCIMKTGEETAQMLDDHIVMTQAMSFSPYKKPFEGRITTWENKLRTTQDVMEEWALCQRSWLYLEPIFSSDDIMRQLPVEGKRYQTMDRMWRKVMQGAKSDPKVISFCADNRLLENLRECNKLLDQVQKGLSDYLETKRLAFPRFYFLSDDELLEILSQTKDPTAVQPHLRKCFENISKLKFEEDLAISQMFSGEGEMVPFSETIYPTGNVEDWLLNVETLMRKSLKKIIEDALIDYPETARTDWVLKWPGQVVIAGCQTTWTAEVSEALEGNQLPEYYQIMLKQLADLVSLVRGKLTKLHRMILSALIVIEVHARDVGSKMLEENVKNVNDFEWISQLRYYWDDELLMRAVNAQFSYGYEYLGNTGRLVITPLTDRCYLTLTGALHLKFGGAPAGPAGTGKTETVKDLAKAMAIQCVVFNCSDQLDFMAMGKFLKGLASTGAWACFDEFNRIDIEVLSVVAQQITTIQIAQQQRLERFLFEGVDLQLRSSCAVFVTMNPGYAGRTELPDNLKALFRPVAMMVPDYAMIAEIMLFSFGFSDAKVLSKKITTTFKLSSEQLSSQDHYDFGMRAVKTVISAAGNIKREFPDLDEELIVLRAIRDANVPKFLMEDLKLFNGIVSDLFPKIRDVPVDYGEMEQSIRQKSIENGLEDVEGFVKKCIQLYETTVVRHGLMLVGPTISGKTKCYQVLRDSLSALKGKTTPGGVPFEQVYSFVLNPKSITMGQLYGEFDALTHEWTDGILACLIRAGVAADNLDKKWFVFDGPVDAIWIENMNTVLDDNKKLCLSSGEIIKLTEAMTMMFEVQDLAVASPATVSRCGMVYLEPSILGLSPFVRCWLKQLPSAVAPYKEQLEVLFHNFMEPSMKFLRKNLKEFVPTSNGSLTFSLLKLLESFFTPFIPKEGEVIPTEKLKAIAKLVEPWFLFALVWSIGATVDGASRKKFDTFLREKIKEHNISLPFPEVGLVYDYSLDDRGASKKGDDEEEEEKKEDKKTKKIPIRWIGWMDNQPEFVVDPTMRFSDIIVPTIDTVRAHFLLELLITNSKQVLCVGPTGTGKTLTTSDKLLKRMPSEFLSHFLAFSAQSSANQTQDIIDSKLDKRRKGIFGPPLRQKFVLFIDDLNMPALEVYGAQPPIELVRQWMDHGGWYDRKAIGSFRKLVDITFVCAMGPPGGGRNPITPRLQRHFNILSFTELEDSSKGRIFSAIISAWLTSFPEAETTIPKLIQATIKVYSTITTELLPTPAKSHYTFNLRDLSKVFQGMLMAPSARVKNLPSLLKLWCHECNRVFEDRLVNNEDRHWFKQLLRSRVADEFESDPDEILGEGTILLYGDFLMPNTDNKVYDEITDFEKMKRICEEYLDDYNQVSTAQMKLVLFLDALCHVCRISRIIRQPLGNALLLGVGGSGRQSLTRLAAHMAEYDLFQIELAKNYGMAEWREDIKNCLMKTGAENAQVVFLFSDTQIKDESMLEDLNNILNSGDVPNIYATEDLDRIYNDMKPLVQDAGQQPTKSNLFSAYTKRVRSNIHVVICMSPIGEVFRARLRQFPSFVNCCTIDWFSEWPDEALKSVAQNFIQEITEIDDPDTIPGLVDTCVTIHQSVAKKSLQYKAELSRYNYVTPTSYLELLGTFAKMTHIKKTELSTQRNRTKTGLDKLLTTASEVGKLQEDLEEMQPQLEAAQIETEETMEQIKKDTIVANETKEVVQKEEHEATDKAEKTQAIADDAQRDLDEALPMLDAALASLKSLNKNDVTEVRALNRPPMGVKLVIDAVCIMKEIKPKRIAGDKPGVKIDDYWEVGKAALQEPQKFLDSLYKYDRDNIPDSVISKIQPYIDNPDFTPEAIAKVSKACTSICQWARAMHKYHFVARAVAPKRAALKEAKESLDETIKLLNDSKARLREVEEGIAALQSKYEECVAKKEELKDKCDLCAARLTRAEKLIGGLADEKIRWKESVDNFDKLLVNVIGDVMVSAGVVAYLGAFTGEYRISLVESWQGSLVELNVPHTEGANIFSILGDPVKIRNWQIAGLPRDTLSVENGIIVQYSRRWPLFIDPQGQANKWVKNMEKDNGLDVVKLTDKDFLRSLENAVRFGKPCLLENVAEELDPALEPILLQQTFKQAGSTVIKLGDSVIPYHDDFKFYITTKLPNPHYTPEVSTKVSLVNFTLSPSGLEDQLLGTVVAEERPDLEEAKNALIISNAKMKQELKEIEDEILYRLSNSEGNPVDDVDLIKVLQASKIKSQEISAKVADAEKTELEIDETRSKYIPVATRTQLLFFCTTDLSNIDPMYQYSLEWYIRIFLNSIASAEKSDDLEERILNINEYFTFSLYSNVCRSLFEKHKLLFSFLLCVRILQNENKIDMSEWHHLIAGGTVTPKQHPNPAPSWISERMWMDLLTLPALPNFSNIASEFEEHIEGYKRMFDSSEPHKEPLPGHWDSDLDDFQKLLVIKGVRADKLTDAMQDFVANSLGQRFIEPQTAELGSVFKDSSTTTPLIFVLSAGTDPAADLYKFAEEMKFQKKLSAISLGQGQGPRAEAMMKQAMDRGRWVFFQNCHLSPSWMPTLERLIEQIDADKVHRDFRLWLTSMPSPKFPVPVLQNSSKMTMEPPRGIKANLLKSYNGFNDEFFASNSKVSEFKFLLFSLCVFHGVTLERRKFGALGFNIPYEFTDGDLRICVSQLSMFLDEYSEIPFKVLKYTAGHINYGGRVTDDWDRRCIMNILNDFYCANALSESYSFSVSGVFHQLPPDADYKVYMTYIRGLPINNNPEIFGLHDNANITFALNETFQLLTGVLKLQPKSSSGGGSSTEDAVEDMLQKIMGNVPKPLPLADLMEKYPVKYTESMNTVLVQEVIRYNRLLSIIHSSLKDLKKALKGLVVMSEALETMFNSIFNNEVPDMWAAKAYPSLKPLAAWVADLVDRMTFIRGWIDDGIPPVFWISGFFFPQAFLTGTLQNYARKSVISIDTISFDFKVIRQPYSEFTSRPDDGCYIRGLFVEGARWDMDTFELEESRPKELYTDMPVMWLIPTADRKQPESGMYMCPVYKTLTRAGTLSTTGHSTNYVIAVEVPSSKPQFHWIKRGVALLCALNY